ncbi:MAG: hypothetical protein ABIS50_26365 [Luteolibacter sp.]|uniref:NADase-type glycan-binding domain-containing protein n=1 Tax=Luteolibacter sp. TaxID=1962973 RepID=UPI003264DCD9
MRINTWLVIGFTVLTQPAFANGGGYFRGGVENMGDVAGFEPKETEKIRILDEKLTVELGAAAADVEVRYLMHNEADKKVTVRFGFPVEESFDRELMTEIGKDGSKKTNTLKYCQDYTIASAGKGIAAKWQEEKKPSDDKRFAGIAGWLVSEITFAAGEEKPVQIRFRSGYPLEEWSVSEDVSAGPAVFKYRLSTAAVWAGTIGTGKIMLKPNGISAEDLKVFKPVNRFKKSGENWVWEFENLEPTMADDLEIEARPKVESTPVKFNGPDHSRYVQRGDRWSMSHVNYQVTASTTLSPANGLSYDAANVKDPGERQTWSEGATGPGIGEWLELTPAVAKPLDAIEMNPGYFKSEELFQANARPKKVLVELNGEYSFTASVSDARTACFIAVRDYAKPVKKIRLTFQEVWPGKHFEDLCVSGIRLHVRLDKKPKLEPVR